MTDFQLGRLNLAKSILFDVTGDKDFSHLKAPDFVEDCIRWMPEEWEMTEVEVKLWINDPAAGRKHFLSKWDF